MEVTFVVLVIAVLLVVYFNYSKKKSMEKVFGLDRSQLLIIDVRSEDEFESGHFSSAINIPHDQIASRIGELKRHADKGIILYCHSGSRSAMAEKVLRSNGFTKVINAGGYGAIRKFDTASAA